MDKFIVKISNKKNVTNFIVCYDELIAKQVLCDNILALYEKIFYNLLNDQEHNYFCYELNDLLQNKNFDGLIKFANESIPSKYNKDGFKFQIIEVPYVQTSIYIDPIYGVSETDALTFKAQNPNLLNNSGCNGATCKNCNQYNEYAVPTNSDGTMICTACKVWQSLT